MTLAYYGKTRKRRAFLVALALVALAVAVAFGLTVRERAGAVVGTTVSKSPSATPLDANFAYWDVTVDNSANPDPVQVTVVDSGAGWISPLPTNCSPSGSNVICIIAAGGSKTLKASLSLSLASNAPDFCQPGEISNQVAIWDGTFSTLLYESDPSVIPVPADPGDGCGELVIAKVCDPFDEGASFTGTIENGPSWGPIGCDQATAGIPLAGGGFYTIFEDFAEGWGNGPVGMATGTGDASEPTCDEEPPGDGWTNVFEVPAGETTVVCIYNQETQKTGIVIQKVCPFGTQADANRRFPFDIPEATYSSELQCDTDTGVLEFQPGTYSVVEDEANLPEGWVLLGYKVIHEGDSTSCSPLVTPDPDADDFTVAADEVVTVCIINDQTTVKVIKICPIDEDGSGFTGTIDDAAAGEIDWGGIGCGGDTGDIPVVAGEVTIEEDTPPAGWTARGFAPFANPGGCPLPDPQNYTPGADVVTLEPGEDYVVCALNTVDAAPERGTITVEKVCIDGDTADGPFEIGAAGDDYAPGDLNLNCGDSEDFTGVPLGTDITVQEEDVPFTFTRLGYALDPAGGCTSDPSDYSSEPPVISLTEEDGTATLCVLNQQSYQIVKLCVEGDQVGDTAAGGTINGSEQTSWGPLDCSSEESHFDLGSPGGDMVKETTAAPPWELVGYYVTELLFACTLDPAQYTTPDEAPDGVLVKPGEVVCILNELQDPGTGQITVAKVCTEGSNGDPDAEGTIYGGGEIGDFAWGEEPNQLGCDESSGPHTVTAGEREVFESTVAGGWTLAGFKTVPFPETGTPAEACAADPDPYDEPSDFDSTLVTVEADTHVVVCVLNDGPDAQEAEGTIRVIKVCHPGEEPSGDVFTVGAAGDGYDPEDLELECLEPSEASFTGVPFSTAVTITEEDPAAPWARSGYATFAASDFTSCPADFSGYSEEAPAVTLTEGVSEAAVVCILNVQTGSVEVRKVEVGASTNTTFSFDWDGPGAFDLFDEDVSTGVPYQSLAAVGENRFDELDQPGWEYLGYAVIENWNGDDGCPGQPASPDEVALANVGPAESILVCFYNTPEPDLDIDKQPDDPVITLGEVIGFTITVSNNSNTTMMVHVYDELPGGNEITSWNFDFVGVPAGEELDNCAISGTPPNEVIECPQNAIPDEESRSVHVWATTTSEVGEPLCRPVQNSALAWESGGASEDSDSAQAEVDIQCARIIIRKLLDSGPGSASFGGAIAGPGDPIPWAVDIASDDKAETGPFFVAPGSYTVGEDQLAPGYSYVTQEDCTTPPIDELDSALLVAFLEARVEGGPYELEDGDTLTVCVHNTNARGAIDVEKVADAPNVDVGGQVGFTITVTNTGNATETYDFRDDLPEFPGVSWIIDYPGIDPEDRLAPCLVNIATSEVVCEDIEIGPGESKFMHVYSETGGEPSTLEHCGVVENTARAWRDSDSTGEPPARIRGDSDSDSDSASVSIDCAHLLIVKMIVGDTISVGNFSGTYDGGPGESSGAWNIPINGVFSGEDGPFLVTPGSYTVTEEPEFGFVFRGLYVTDKECPLDPPGNSPPTVEAGADEIVVVCLYNEPVGTIRLTKVDLVPGSQEWNFTLSGGTGGVPDQQIVDSGSVLIEDIPTGGPAWTVSESVPPGLTRVSECPVEDSTPDLFVTTVSLAQGHLDEPGDAVEFIFTNRPCPVSEGLLVVRKVADFNGDGLLNGPDTFVAWEVSVSGLGDVAVPANAAGAQLVLPANSYAVEEDVPPGWANVGYRIEGGGFNDDETIAIVQVAGAETTVLTFFNQPLGSVRVQKVEEPLSGGTRPGVGWTFTLEGCGVGPISQATGVDGTTTFDNLPLAINCEYGVTETVRGGWSPVGGTAKSAAPDTPGEVVTVTFFNVEQGGTTPTATQTQPTETVTQPGVVETPSATQPTEATQPARPSAEEETAGVSTPIAPEAGTGGGSGAGLALWLALAVAAVALLGGLGGLALLAPRRRRAG
jgi:uncharacterized repeat protein (TIGR01451 family)